MGLSDCQMCWETPCSCGWEYRLYPVDRLSQHIADITQYRKKEEAIKILENSLKILKNDEPSKHF